jgi:hypothetical protein
MYNLGTVIPAKLSITWEAIIGILSILGTFWGVYKIIGSKVSKTRYYGDLKELREELEKLHKTLKDEMDCKEIMNTRNHGEMRAEITLTENRVKDEFWHSMEQMQILIKSIDENVKVILGRKR